jgi:3-methyladenine DNA glycosylase AlkC
MGDSFSALELRSASTIVADLQQGHLVQGIERLEALKNDVYAAIPDRRRRSRGITWVVQRISKLLLTVCEGESEAKEIALILYRRIERSDRLIGVPIFLMAAYGRGHFGEVIEFFEHVADAENWEVREFAAGGFRSLLRPNKAEALPWLKRTAMSKSPNVRRFVSEMLRPVAKGRWLIHEPKYSLSVLRLMFREAHPYPRTSVGNNLSDLSKHHPGLIFSIIDELAATGDQNSHWIAYRACRNLVKEYPERVMDALGIDEYHYKDRHFYREESRT